MRPRDDLGTAAWNCHLHPSLRFSGSSNHLIHAFLAVASLGNLCPPKVLHLGTQHSVPRLFLLRLSMPPTATHQPDNSYGRSAIWRVSKFVSGTGLYLYNVYSTVVIYTVCKSLAKWCWLFLVTSIWKGGRMDFMGGGGIPPGITNIFFKNRISVNS